MKIEKIKLVFFIVAAMWAIYGIDLILHYQLNAWGIIPRTSKGLIGIVASPFLHANLAHLIGNTIPLVVLIILLVVIYEKIAPSVIGVIVVVGGGLVWILGRTANHIGASGVIYGTAAFLIFYGIMKKNVVSIVIAALVIFLFGGSMLSGLMPFQTYISWEGHLFSAAAGVLAAYIYRNR